MRGIWTPGLIATVWGNGRTHLGSIRFEPSAADLPTADLPARSNPLGVVP